MSVLSRLLARLALALGLMVVVGWPAIATVQEASRAWALRHDTVPASGASLDQAGSAAMLRDSGAIARPLRLAIETVSLVAITEAICVPLGILLALFLFRTDAWGQIGRASCRERV